MEFRLNQVVAIIQARLGSTRLPGKVLKLILGRPVLWHIVNRVRSVTSIGEVVVATSALPADQTIIAFARKHDVPWFAGSENDVLDRFYHAAMKYGGDPIVRITGDCPLVDPGVLGRVIELYRSHEGKVDLVSVATGAGVATDNFKGGRFPDGLDGEVIAFAALDRAWREAIRASDREHVTPYIWRNTDMFRVMNLTSETDYSQLRWTLDNQEDLEVISRIYAALYREDRPFLMGEVLALLSLHPELAKMNDQFIGREGYSALWQD